LSVDKIRKQRGEETRYPEKLEARVKSVTRRPAGELKVELENGQVWAETESHQTSFVKEGEMVTIKPGRFGSYFLSTHSGYAFRVVRLQ
jgi:hypothetical protein